MYIDIRILTNFWECMISHQETAGGGITFYVNMKLEYMELFLKMGEELPDSLNVRITGRAGTRDKECAAGHLMKKADETFYR